MVSSLNNLNKILVIAIDGPAGAGKSTLAKQLAKKLNIFYLDTGAMYRALTWKAIQEGIDLENEDQLAALAKRTNIDFESSPQGLKIVVDGRDVSEEIRTVDVTNKTFYIARAGKVREIMVDWQRKIAGEKSVVAEGRDIGTVVFPNATYKFYLDADIDERSRRRIAELEAKGKHVDVAQLKKELQERDQKDFTRSVGPLKKAQGAVVIDSTRMSIDDMTTEILKHI